MLPFTFNTNNKKNNMIYLGNTLSAFGAIFLLLGYYSISVKKDEKKGFLFNGIGSVFMGVSFAIFGSMAFIVLNVVWTGISISGYLNRSNPKSDKKIALSYKPFAFGVLALLIAQVACWLTDSYEIMSWLSISVFLAAYSLFSLQIFKRTQYVFFSISENIILIPYLLFLSNYSSIVQTLISIFLSSYALAEIYKERGKVATIPTADAAN